VNTFLITSIVTNGMVFLLSVLLFFVAVIKAVNPPSMAYFLRGKGRESLESAWRFHGDIREVCPKLLGDRTVVIYPPRHDLLFRCFRA
jgi:hypothetical protein